MKSTGNGIPQNCMQNLLQITRGEVRFDNLRGIDAAILDLPETYATTKLQADAYWVVSVYEPRLNFDGAELTDMMKQGDFSITSTAK